MVGAKTPDVSPEVFKSFFAKIQELLRAEKILAGHDVSSGGLIVTLLEMSFAGDIGFDAQIDSERLLFSEKPGVVIQVREADEQELIKEFSELGLEVLSLGAVGGDAIKVKTDNSELVEYVASLRDVWFKPSSLLDEKQTYPGFAQKRYQNYASQKLSYDFKNFKEVDVGDTGEVRAAIIRDKGTNGDRELAYALHAAGFLVKDIAMPDLMSGRETLEDVSFLAFPGGFSNSDVLGSARGWAGSFIYNEPALRALESFKSRPDTLSLGVCNGCQLMAHLDLLCPELAEKPSLMHNDSRKFESIFLNVDIEKTASVMLKPLEGQRLGIWVAHGEGKFELSGEEENYDIPMKYSYSEYPGNPNGSKYKAAAVVSSDGRHLAMMPHLERSTFSWQWPYRNKQISVEAGTPWLAAFVAARQWIQNTK